MCSLQGRCDELPPSRGEIRVSLTLEFWEGHSHVR